MARFDDKKLQTDNLVDKLVSINVLGIGCGW